MTLACMAGCGGGEDPDPNSNSGPAVSERDQEGWEDGSDPPQSVPPQSAVPGASGDPAIVPAEPLPTVNGEPDSERESVAAVTSSNDGAGGQRDDAGGQRDADSPQRQLRDDLDPSELTRFLAEADQQMHRVATGTAGIMEEDQALAEMRRVVEQKLEASRRLASHEQADGDQQIEGRRGELQALSHLASLGDLQAAEELEQLAERHLDSDDESLRTDSRLVRLGFAIETLRHGKAGAAEEIVSQVEDLVAEVSDTNLPAMVVMGQAREVLELYSYDEQARRVREVIIEHFADSEEPSIARMAAELAGTVRYDEIEPLRAAAVSGEEISESRWRQSVAGLIEASSDIMTVRYLAGAALELEGADRMDLADITYQLLDENFSDPSIARDREAQMALAARDARQSVIGRPFDPDLPSIDGSPLPFDQFEGQVVLMPFWDSRFPQSLQLLAQLTEIREAYPDRVTIVGMNLDLESTTAEELAQFSERAGIDFPSYRSPSTPSAAVANEVAQQFGLVSMPFTVLFDPQGQVAALELSGEHLQATVERLLEEA